MPKQTGFLKFQGKLNGISYYCSKGEYIMRKANGPTKHQINTNPAYANLKARNQEFGAASKLSKAIRLGLGNNSNQFADTYLASHLTAIGLNLIQKGSGVLGKRILNIHNHPQALLGIPLHKKQSKPTLLFGIL